MDLWPPMLQKYTGLKGGNFGPRHWVADQPGLVYKSIQRNDDAANKDDSSPVISRNFDGWNEIPGIKAGEVFWKDKYSTRVFRDSQVIQKCKAFLVGWNSAQGARPESQCP
ncbi:hypothetical protein N8T08_004634 [Aspergillus melleus]|uniref:Uncharacterized protein n=1 Tax=Aspergillus melleus TaxID=138277 RepID=A0ACC3B3S4_9EURO|nr:hypothetical protein N8T08_004634 [Aspergillus melleus]